MNETTKILDLMVEDHKLIEDMLDDLYEARDDFNQLSSIFNDFEWTLEKHIFTEEKAVFTCYEPDNVTEGYNMLPTLTEQHNFILNKLKKWRRSIRNRDTLSDINSFSEYLKDHRKFEEKDFYPKLDKTLNDEQKNRVISRIREIV